MDKKDWIYLLKKEFWAVSTMIIGAYLGMIIAHTLWYGKLINYDNTIYNVIVCICTAAPGLKVLWSVYKDHKNEQTQSVGA